jgi:signal transduction histidine kinase/streptogramin lyase
MEGLAEQSVYWFSENPIGDLWLATGRAGAIRLTSGGFHTYTEPDGFRPQEVNQVMETRDGQLCVVNGDRSKRLTQCFNGEGFLQRNVLQRPDLQFGFERRQFALQDHLGQWWFATERGALKIPDLMRPAEAGQSEFISTLPMSWGVWQLFEDSKKIIWMAEESADSNAVVTWNPFTRTTNIVWRKSNSGASKKTMASCFLQHRTGQIWIGLSGEGGVLRSRGDHFDFFGRQDGVPSGEITGLYQDHSNHVWLASTEGGLGKVDDPAADHPHIRTYTRTNGLSSDEIWCITEDQAGRIYVGTGRGVDAVDPATNHVVNYTPDDGLVPGRVSACFCDRAGELWFVTDRGVSRFNLARELPHDLPRTLITEFRIRGATSRVSQLGALQVGPVQLSPTQNQVTIDFFGMDSRLRGDLRYQYRLLGADTSWSKSMQERSITFATLASRRYRFEVRAVDAHGGLSIPAVAEFSISPPVWQRWWFELLASLALLGLLYWLHHYRTLRLLELERVRTRIATDLHDDIGSSLSQIAVLSEVARQRGGCGKAAEALERIGGLSRELLDSIGDVVWAIQPDKDHLSDLRQRMRRFAADVFSTGNVEMHWSATGPERDFELDSGTRREVYLIFKETIRNIVRHSRATEARIALAVLDGYLSLEVSDNGRGIERFDRDDGNGLRNMKLRAERLGGDLEVRPAAGKGTTVRLRAPLWMRAAGRRIAT